MKFVQARHFYQGGNHPRIIVIHDMEYPEKPTGAAWCADFFAGPQSPQASAHYAVDNGEIVQMVKDADGAWHTPGALGGVEINRMSIGVEHAGYARQTAAEWQDAYSVAELELSAQLVADLCAQYGIPPVKLTPEDLKAGKSGICGHVDCTVATGSGDHTDPGPNFPWDWYIGRVLDHREAPAPAPDHGEEESAGWVRVVYDDVWWLVAPIYVPFVGIGQAKKLAESLDCELPTPALVDAIYAQADLKIDGSKMTQPSDGTALTMASQAMFEKVTAKLESLVAGRALGVDFKLLAGAFKDVVEEDGKLGIYGWHKADGRPIQPFYTGHSPGWIDYSQGLRLCRRVLG